MKVKKPRIIWLTVFDEYVVGEFKILDSRVLLGEHRFCNPEVAGSAIQRSPVRFRPSPPK